MARKVTKAEAEQIISWYKNTRVKIESSYIPPSKQYFEDVKSKVEFMLKKNFFNDAFLEELNTDKNPTLNKAGLADLISKIYLYKLSRELLKDRDFLLTKYKDEFNYLINTARIATKGITWNFLSSLDKEAAEKAYEKLFNIKKSFFSNEVDDFLNNVNSISRLNEEVAWSDFSANSDYYRKFINRYRNKIKFKTSYTEASEKLINQAEKIKEAYKTATLFLDVLTKEAENASKDYQRKIVLRLLEDVPVEEITRRLPEINIRNYRRRGFKTIADFVDAKPTVLSGLLQVDSDTANKISKIVKSIQRSAKKSAGIKLSTDSKNEESTRLVVALSSLLKARHYLEEIQPLHDVYSERLTESLDVLNKLGKKLSLVVRKRYY